MTNNKQDCSVCHKGFSSKALFPLELLRSSLYETIHRDHPEVMETDLICAKDLERYRSLYKQTLSHNFQARLSKLPKAAAEKISTQQVIAENLNVSFKERLTFGERASDKLASFGGSWTFITIFGVVLVLWMIINTYVLSQKAFDPYPYILLNLVLSCLAAIQAPIIMMSQNRQEKKDRLRSENDYHVNLKAELEIRHLNAKLDHLILHHWLHTQELGKAKGKGE